MDKICLNCKHLGDMIKLHSLKDADYEYFRCEKIPDVEIGETNQAFIDKIPAFIEGGHEAWVTFLCVHRNFGCNLWEARHG